MIIYAFSILSLTLLSSCSFQQTTPSDSTRQFIKADAALSERKRVEAFGQKYAISTQGQYASLAAQQMFESGGNIIDAAIASSFTLAVERPQSTGIGGGGFMLFYEAKSQKVYAIDFRERAPLKAHKNMYLDAQGQFQSALSQNGILAGAIPGMVAGLTEIHQKFGKLPLSKVLTPAIKLANDGFQVYPHLARALTAKSTLLSQDIETRKIFLDAQGQPLKVGTVLKQPQLAHSLTLIAQKGRSGFYKGEIAKALVQFSKERKGLIEQKDLDSYQVKWRKPLSAQIQDYEVFSMPPPSSGGVHVIQFLKMLENTSMTPQDYMTSNAIHKAAGSLQMAFADRATYLGDPDFNPIPVDKLISSTYTRQRFLEIQTKDARSADQVQAGHIPLQDQHESPQTTHFSIIDSEGNAIASTQTINGWMGASIVIPGTGILLNNEMDDFSAKASTPNMFGAIGGEANSIAPAKTPLSSMSPTIVTKDGSVLLSLGAPGGTRIISCVAQTLLNFLTFNESLYESIASVRYHHQWHPDVLEIEPPGPPKKTINQLKSMGYNLEIKPIECYVMAVAREGNQLHGVADPRDIGSSIAH